MNKTKNKIPEEISQEDLPLVPPEVHYLSESYVVKLPLNDERLHKLWELRVYVARILERHLGDEVQLTSLKVKKPHIIAKRKAGLRGQEPCARAYVTIKF